jgi:hypothetical protein
MKYIKGYSKEVQDIALQAITNADAFGVGRLTSVKNALINSNYEGIANNAKLLDNLVFKIGEQI